MECISLNQESHTLFKEFEKAAHSPEISLVLEEKGVLQTFWPVVDGVG